MQKFKSRTAKAFSGFLGIATAVSMFAGIAVVPAQAAALTPAQVQSIVSLLQSFGADQGTITNVQASLNGQPTTGTMNSSGATTCSYTFTKTLKKGSKNQEVWNLQKVLNMNPSTQVAASGAGSPGNEVMSFGSATKAAVIAFQNMYASSILTPVGLTKGTGVVGAATRAKLNMICSGSAMSVPGMPGVPGTVPGTPGTTVGTTVTTGTTGTGTTTTTAGTSTVAAGTLTVAAAASQPSNTLAPANAARVPFTKFVLTNPGTAAVTVNGITVERDGPASDSDFSGIILLDENGNQIDIAKTLNSNHQTVIGGTFTVNPGQTRTLTIAGNIAASPNAGEVPVLSLVAVNTSATVTGAALPFSGAQQTINTTLTIGSVTLGNSSFDPGTAQTKQVGVTGIKFSGFRVTAGSAEGLKITTIRWNQTGSAASSDLANVVTYVNGVAYPTTVDSTGKYYVASIPNGGLFLDKGVGTDIYIQGDIVGSGSSGRTVEFDVYKTTDLYVNGATYGFGITPPTSGTAMNGVSSSNPWLTGYKVTIAAGSATTIQKSTNVPAQNIAVGVADQPLGGFDVSFIGEPVSENSMKIVLTNSATAPGTTGNITGIKLIDENGKVVAGPKDATTASGAYLDQSVTLTDTVVFPAGGTHTYKIVGKVPTGYSNNEGITASTTPSGWGSVTGQTTGNNITLTQGLFAMNQMTVKAGTLAVATAATPAAQNIVAGQTGVLFANYQLDASASGEDVRFSSIPVFATYTGGAVAANLSNCQFFSNGMALNTGSNVLNSPAAGTSTITLDQSMTVPKGTVSTVAFKCNVAGGTTASSAFSFGTYGGPSGATGVSSSASITPTVTTSIGQAMTVVAGSMTITNDASTPSYTIAAANTTGVTMGVAKFHATNEGINLTKIGLTLTNTASSSAQDLVQVTLWQGTTQVGAVVFTGSNTSATTTLVTPIVLANNADTQITVKGDLAAVGTSQPGTEGHLIAVDVLNAQGTGVGDGVTINVGAGTSFAGVRVFKSYPTISLDTLPSTGMADGRLLHFKVTAASNGDIGIEKFSFNIATSVASVSSINLFGYTDSAYSQPIQGVTTGGQIQATNASTSYGVAAPNFDIYPQTGAAASTTVQVPAGQTRYFELRGSMTGVTTGASVITKLLGDNQYPNLGLGVFVATSTTIDTPNAAGNRFVADDFIWSPNSTSTSGVGTVDWTNGYGLPGLPSSGIISTRGI